MGVRSWLIEEEEAYETIRRQQIRLGGPVCEHVLQAGAETWKRSSASSGLDFGAEGLLATSYPCSLAQLPTKMAMKTKKDQDSQSPKMKTNRQPNPRLWEKLALFIKKMELLRKIEGFWFCFLI